MRYFVDVWQGGLQWPLNRWQFMFNLLSADERLKAERYATEQARHRFVIFRGMLRQTLASYLSLAPEELKFELGEFGKPYLANGDLYFNLSHTADDWLLAVANFAPIGVDLEIIRPRTQLQNLVDRCFSERESAYWQALPGDQQLEAFFRLWTKKEAFVKAVGRGLALGLENCEFEPRPAGQLLAIPSEYGEASAWTVREFVLAPALTGALVTPNRDYELRHLHADLNEIYASRILI